MKTPDEIKKGLELCTTVGSHCDECPYDGQCLTDRPPEVDALAYILQLENDLQYTTDAANIMKDEALKLEFRLAQVERERDTAVQTVHGLCHHCKNNRSEKCRKCLFWPSRVYFVSTETYVDHWEWRGVCEENTKEESP